MTEEIEIDYSQNIIPKGCILMEKINITSSVKCCECSQTFSFFPDCALMPYLHTFKHTETCSNAEHTAELLNKYNLFIEKKKKEKEENEKKEENKRKKKYEEYQKEADEEFKIIYEKFKNKNLELKEIIGWENIKEEIHQIASKKINANENVCNLMKRVCTEHNLDFEKQKLFRELVTKECEIIMDNCYAKKRNREIENLITIPKNAFKFCSYTNIPDFFLNTGKYNIYSSVHSFFNKLFKHTPSDKVFYLCRVNVISINNDIVELPTLLTDEGGFINPFLVLFKNKVRVSLAKIKFENDETEYEVSYIKSCMNSKMYDIEIKDCPFFKHIAKNLLEMNSDKVYTFFPNYLYFQPIEF